MFTAGVVMIIVGALSLLSTRRSLWYARSRWRGPRVTAMRSDLGLDGSRVIVLCIVNSMLVFGGAALVPAICT